VPGLPSQHAQSAGCLAHPQEAKTPRQPRGYVDRSVSASVASSPCKTNSSQQLASSSSAPNGNSHDCPNADALSQGGSNSVAPALVCVVHAKIVQAEAVPLLCGYRGMGISRGPREEPKLHEDGVAATDEEIPATSASCSPLAPVPASHPRRRSPSWSVLVSSDLGGAGGFELLIELRF